MTPLRERVAAAIWEAERENMPPDWPMPTWKRAPAWKRAFYFRWADAAIAKCEGREAKEHGS